MTIVLDLPPETEARVSEMASRHGQKPEEYALRLLDEISRAEKAESDAVVAGVRRGMADAAAGREISLEDYLAEIATRRNSVNLLISSTLGV